MRKYISEGFVSILAQPCLLYIWDMLFLYEWDAQVQTVTSDKSINYLIRYCLTIASQRRRANMVVDYADTVSAWSLTILINFILQAYNVLFYFEGLYCYILFCRSILFHNIV